LAVHFGLFAFLGLFGRCFRGELLVGVLPRRPHLELTHEEEKNETEVKGAIGIMERVIEKKT
jgi:hypothetical protein